MTQAELETIFDALAQGIDQAGEASEIFLPKGGWPWHLTGGRVETAVALSSLHR